MNELTDKILSWMSDEESKEIYRNRVMFEETHDYSYIQDTIDKYLPMYSQYKWFCISDKLKETMSHFGRIIVAGVGGRGKILIKALQDEGYNLELCIDNGYTGLMRGIKVVSPSEAEYKDACVIISISLDAISKLVKKQLLELGVLEKQIVILSDYVSPAMEAHDIEYFDDDTIIKYGESEVFVDCGVLDFENSNIFYNKCCENNVKDVSIYAFEPDKNNYDVSLREAEKLKKKGANVYLYNKGVWSEDKEIGFAGGKGGGSKIVEGGVDSISVVALDSVVKEKVTYIKMDIEGAELEALKGAKQMIQTYRPRLAICIYHKPEDIVEIPLYIKKLVPDYKLYVRHYSNNTGELVLYAI